MDATYLHFTIENPYLGESLVLNDVTTDPTKYYTITESPISELNVRTNSVNRLGRNFVKTDYSFYGERQINIKGQIVVTDGSISNMENLVANLKKIFALPPLPNSSNDGFVTLKWTDQRGNDWQMEVKLVSDIKITSIFNLPYVKNYEINLIAEDGLIYSQAVSSVSEQTAFYTSKLTLPCTLPAILDSDWLNELDITNAGNYPTPPIFTIYGYAENPLITHAESGNFIKLEGYTVQAGRYVVINVGEGTIELDDGTDLSAYLSDDSTWFYIESGTNTVRLTHDGNYLLGSLECEWRNAEI